MYCGQKKTLTQERGSSSLLRSRSGRGHATLPVPTGIYCKPTHTDQYLQFSSHHPLIHKLGVIRTLEHRANTLISHPDEVEKEKEHIRKVLNLCGYPSWAFQKASSSSQRDHQRQGQEQRTGPSGLRNIRITIPYVTGVSDTMKSVFRSFGFSTTFKPCNTLRQKLVNVKDKPRNDKISHAEHGIRDKVRFG